MPHSDEGGAANANVLAFLVFFVARTEVSAGEWRQFRRRRMYLYVFASVVLSVLTILFASALPFHFSFVWMALMPVIFWIFRVQWLGIFQLVRVSAARKSD